MGRRFESSRARGGGWVAGQSILFAAIAAGCFLRSSQSTWSDAAGGALIALGLIVVVSARVALGEAFTAFPTPKPDAPVATRGPYNYVRHPMYTGVVLIALGASILRGSWPALVLTGVLAVFFELKARREEAWLATREGYAAYRARVRGRLLPRGAGRRSRS